MMRFLDAIVRHKDHAALWLRQGAVRAQWRAWHGFLSRYLDRRGAGLTCMNWGYDDGRPLPGSESRARDSSRDNAEGYALKLYQAVVAGTRLQGRVVADIGCGRGGGIAYVQAAFAPRRAIGVDNEPAYLRACARAYGGRQPGLVFERADAVSLPFADGSVDVLLSVESSHGYGDVNRFVAEACRVVPLGGSVLWADFIPEAEYGWLRCLVHERFCVREERNITAQVLAACERDAARRAAEIASYASPLVQPLLVHATAAGEQAESVKRLRSGAYRYFLLKLDRCAR